MKNKRQNIHEVEQPQSQGEKNFKGLHNPINHKNLVPGVTDQEHVFSGATKPYENKFPNSYKPGGDRTVYDKNVKVDGSESDNGYETAKFESTSYSAKEAHAGKDIGKPGKNFSKIADAAAKRYGSKEAGKKVAGAILAKLRKEEIDYVEEKHLTPAELKKREEVAKAIARKNPSMPMSKKMAIATATAKKVAESYDDTHDEVSMVRTELKAMIASAQDLLNNMSMDMHVEPWVQSKIAIAKSMVCGVHDHMLYSDKDDQPYDSNLPSNTGSSYQDPFMNREEYVGEALGSIRNQKAGAMMRYRDSRKGQPELSPKQKKIASIAGDPDKIDADDFKVLRASKKIHEARVCKDCGEGHYVETKGGIKCDECGATPHSMKEDNVGTYGSSTIATTMKPDLASMKKKPANDERNDIIAKNDKRLKEETDTLNLVKQSALNSLKLKKHTLHNNLGKLHGQKSPFRHNLNKSPD